MERFVQLLVAGGLALLAGLWLLALADRGAAAWPAGLGLAILGTAGLAAGIAMELEW